MKLLGRIHNGVVQLAEGSTLREGTLVQVSPLAPVGDPLALPAALNAAPRPSPEDVAEWDRVLAARKRPAFPH